MYEQKALTAILAKIVQTNAILKTVTDEKITALNTSDNVICAHHDYHKHLQQTKWLPCIAKKAKQHIANVYLNNNAHHKSVRILL